MAGYGIGPTSTTSGEPQALSGARSTSAWIRVAGVADHEGRELQARAVGGVYQPREDL